MAIPVVVTAAAPYAGKTLAAGAAAAGATVVGLKAQQFARSKAQDALENIERAVEAVRETRKESKESPAQEAQAS